MLECPRDFSDLMKFEVTAISAIDEEHMLTERKARTHVFEAKLGLNTSNDHFDDRLRPGIPDVTFEINLDDELVKDQQEGFQWWWGRDEPNVGMGFITHSSIVDLFPMTVQIPQKLLNKGFEAHMSVEGNLNKLFVYKVVDQPPADRLAHLRDPARAERQLAASAMACHISSAPYPIYVSRGDEPIEYLAKPWGSGVEQATLFLWLKDSGGNFIPVDSWRATFKDPQEYWAFYSARNKAAGTLGYRVEDDRVVSSEFYTIDPKPIGGVRDPAKSKYLVMLHGFNNTEDDARTRFNEIWKRLFWLGFRGQFVGVTWHGDVGGIFSPVNFDPSTRNALQTSTALMLFLHGHVRNWAGGVENVDVLAHSLGNLVVWDAMRLYQRTGQGANNPLFRNLISVEAAVWPETFDPEGSVEYTDEINPVYNISYTMDDLKEHSWKAWFNQSAYPANVSLGGHLYHSFVPDDYALEWLMRLNDKKNRGGGLLGIGMPYHFNRWGLHSSPPDAPEWRAPEGEKQSNTGWGNGQLGNNVHNRLHDRIPTLMLPGHRKVDYGYKDLNLPIGSMEHPVAASDNQQNATKNGLGWRAGKHSDFAAGESGDADVDMWFPKIWNWYQQLVQLGIFINEE